MNFPVDDGEDSIPWRELLERTAGAVGDRSVARWLCEHAAGLDGADFDAARDEKVSARAGMHLDAMVRRVLAGEPVQYAMGRWAFRRLDLLVDRRVLIPRPETELVVDIVLDELAGDASSPPRLVADLGTGSGAIGLAVLSEAPPGSVETWMTDASEDALDVARANTAGLGRAGAGARFAAGDWWDALPRELEGRFRVVASNPPYIDEGDEEVEASVREWEPPIALFSDDEGLADIAEIVEGATTWLAPGGLLVVEHGHTQGERVRATAIEAGLVEVDTRRDLAGRDRFLIARRQRRE